MLPRGLSHKRYVMVKIGGNGCVIVMKFVIFRVDEVYKCRFAMFSLHRQGYHACYHLKGAVCGA